jgi:GntR family transcriptional regulator of abcA and norABC
LAIAERLLKKGDLSMADLKWQPDRNASSRLYLQIKEFLIDKIVSGEWPVGSKLPSQRTLSETFGVNRSTIVTALNELIADGLIQGNAGGGTKVTNDTWNILANNHEPNWNHYVSSGLHQANPDIVQLINKYEFEPDIIRMGSCEPATDMIPTTVIRDLLKCMPDDAPLGYLEPNGSIDLRIEICKYLKTIDIEAKPSSVLIVSGAMQALQLISLSLLYKGSVVYLEKPSYLYSLKFFRSSGITLSGITMDKEGLNIDELITRHKEKKGSMLFSIPTFHNPSGNVMTLERRKELIKTCGTLQLPIVEDDVYRELWYDEKPPLSLKALDKNDLVLYVGSMSKNLCPGLRIGWIVGPTPVIKRLADIKMQFDYGSSSLSQWLAAEIFKNGLYSTHNDLLRKKAKLRRDTALIVLDRSFSKIATWNIPTGGYFIWLKLNSSISMHELFTKAINKKILINPGNLYEFHSTQHIRISFSYASLTEIEEGLEALAMIIKDM